MGFSGGRTWRFRTNGRRGFSEEESVPRERVEEDSVPREPVEESFVPRVPVEEESVLRQPKGLQDGSGQSVEAELVLRRPLREDSVLQAVVERQFCATGAPSGLLKAILCYGKPAVGAHPRICRALGRLPLKLY